MKLAFEQLEEKINEANTSRSLGRVTKIVGLMLEADGLHVEQGELCIIRSNNKEIKAEVVGFKDNTALLMPLGEIHEVKMGAEVIHFSPQCPVAACAYT